MTGVEKTARPVVNDHGRSPAYRASMGLSPVLRWSWRITGHGDDAANGTDADVLGDSLAAAAAPLPAMSPPATIAPEHTTQRHPDARFIRRRRLLEVSWSRDSLARHHTSDQGPRTFCDRLWAPVGAIRVPANALAERCVDTVLCECSDRMLVLGGRTSPSCSPSTSSTTEKGPTTEGSMSSSPGLRVQPPSGRRGSTRRARWGSAGRALSSGGLQPGGRRQ